MFDYELFEQCIENIPAHLLITNEYTQNQQKRQTRKLFVSFFSHLDFDRDNLLLVNTNRPAQQRFPLDTQKQLSGGELLKLQLLDTRLPNTFC
jgi:hypothetical protein